MRTEAWRDAVHVMHKLFALIFSRTFRCHERDVRRVRPRSRDRADAGWRHFA